MPRTLLVGQAGGATAVINSSLVGVVRQARESGAFDRIIGMRRGAEGALEEDLVDLTNVPDRVLHAIQATPGAALQSSRHKVTDDELEALLDLCKRLGVDSFLYIGGNDSADTTHRLAQHAEYRGQTIHAIAVPKTIDNDLPITDHCPGYGSIARYVAVATMDSAQDTESMPTMYPVKFIEVMGRDAGWVVAASAVAKQEHQDAPHLLYPPERPLDPSCLLEDVQRVYDDIGWVVAVVAETVRDRWRRPFGDPGLSAERDRFGHPLIRGTADAMVRLVQSELGLRSRFDKPGSLQRMASMYASAVDRAEAEEVGRAAVRLALQGESDRMVTLVRECDAPYACTTGSAPLREIANRQRLLPDDSIAADGSHVSEAFRRYALPLLGPDPFPSYARLD